ncbi:MarR family winged helix-turn-helix transcriptional regulator [Bordetella petrii]|uniref:MarR family winged helix-turn-helix transcriptional regulator n=1 Tax=Bordetella petrii TaxID=94624 RepID=UPI001E49F765|nr:MarR family transcriptional regulator [Bordetella petrii]MCD0501796.1 MarR family transcriptional regulator [Bordetella petrii]
MRDHVDFVISQWHEQCPDLDVAPMAVFSRLFRLHTLAVREVDATFRKHDLHQGEFDVLATLYRAGPPHALNPQALVSALLLSSGAMTNRLDRLETAGLLVREPNPGDRRSVVVSLTPPGLRLIKAALGDYLQELEQLLAPLPAADRKRLALLLRRLLSAHDRRTPGAIRASARP